MKFDGHVPLLKLAYVYHSRFHGKMQLILTLFVFCFEEKVTSFVLTLTALVNVKNKFDI